ncbi:MAG: hypothetical protein ACI8PT_003425, partial [Gammaproteobacteria bacterium]
SGRWERVQIIYPLIATPPLRQISPDTANPAWV